MENNLLRRVRVKRQIQEAKINLIKMLSECETEEQLVEIMKLKDQLMDSYYGKEGRLAEGDQARGGNDEIEPKAMSDQFYN